MESKRKVTNKHYIHYPIKAIRYNVILTYSCCHKMGKTAINSHGSILHNVINSTMWPFEGFENDLKIIAKACGLGNTLTQKGPKPTRRNSRNSREFREFSIQNSRRSRGIHVVCLVGKYIMINTGMETQWTIIKKKPICKTHFPRAQLEIYVS